jgi:hypothetical protein
MNKMRLAGVMGMHAFFMVVLVPEVCALQPYFTPRLMYWRTDVFQALGLAPPNVSIEYRMLILWFADMQSTWKWNLDSTPN